MDQGFRSSLEKAFRCQIYGVKPKRTVYMVRTNRGLWVVKGYREEEKARWVTNLARALEDQGFFHSVQYVQTPSGQHIVPYGRKFYTVMKSIEGRESSYAERYDVKKAATTLARFHNAAKGFTVEVSMYGTKPAIIDKWERRLDEFEQITCRIETRGAQNRMEQMILSLAKDIKRDGSEALRKSYEMPLMQEMHEAIALGTMAHRDVASHNFLLTDRGSCYLIDLDTVMYDMQLVDLLQFMSRTLFLHGYSFDMFESVLDAYSKVRPLRDQQITMIYELLRYPDNALREITGLYAKQSGYRMRGVMQLLQLEQRVRHQRRRFLGLDDNTLRNQLWSDHVSYR